MGKGEYDMMIVLKPYRGCEAALSYKKPEKKFFGKVLNLPKNISIYIEGSTINEAEEIFHEAIDDLISFEGIDHEGAIIKNYE